MKTLPDYLRPGLRLLSVGLNPSPPSVAAGFYFANPRNRFWRALNASELLDTQVQPGTAAMQTLFERYATGFTDLVKRPTPGAAQLRAADYREGAERLYGLLVELQPAMAWFHGKVAFKQFARYAAAGEEDTWGLQQWRIGATRCFVTPNPSPANAAYSLENLVAWYDRLAGQLRAVR